ncbi:MAG: hypothetical protein QM541_00625 [Flavobacterium sp.]|nr:hypothetical protein [Flavobacterium sp.]
MSSLINGYKVGAIKRAIEHYIHPNNKRSDIIPVYGNWYIGITNNAQIRKAQHKKEKSTKALYFNYWDAGNKLTAVEIEKYFHLLGMKDKATVGGAKSDSSYVYIFKLRTTIVDDIAHLFGLVK